MANLARAGSKRRVLVLGGGFGGAYAAQRLSRRLPNDWELTLVDRNNFLLFYPLLVEAGVGSLEARHVVVPLRKFLRRGSFLMAEIQSVDLQGRTAQIQIIGADEAVQIRFDHLVIATGSATKFPPIPGLKENAFQFKSLADGIDLRDRGIRLLELANTIDDPEKRRAILRVVVVGANFTGIEFAGEYQAFLRDAARSYPRVSKDEVGIVVLDLADRLLNALEPDLAEYARKHLSRRGMDIRMKTSVSEVGERHVVLTTGERLDAYTTVWCAGITPGPLLDSMPGLPRNRQGYIECEPDLSVKGCANVWAIGDLAAVLDAEGKPYAATAQNATREGVLCADNILRSIRNEPLRPFRFNSLGSLAAIGCRTAVAKVFGIKLSGFVAWFAFRTVYLFKMPGWGRRFRIMMDWTADLFLRAEPVQLGLRHAERGTPEEFPKS